MLSHSRLSRFAECNIQSDLSGKDTMLQKQVHLLHKVLQHICETPCPLSRFVPALH